MNTIQRKMKLISAVEYGRDVCDFSQPPSIPDSPNLVESSAQAYDALCPVDPVTGKRINAMRVVLNPSIALEDKQFLIQTMTGHPNNAPSGMSDEDLANAVHDRRSQSWCETKADMDKIQEQIKDEQTPPE